jgi:hypothetical protein
MVGATEITIASISSSGAQGSDYPIMTVAFQLPTNVSIGTKLPFSLDPASTWTLGLLGTATVKPFPPATITVGISSISITDVIPGGGLLPAGTVASIEGMGFQSKTQVQLSGFQASAITVVSPQEIQIVLAQATQLTGKKIQVTNPDGSSATYFSYMRGILLEASARPLLASAKPIFSSVTYSQAVFAAGMSSTASQYGGIAAQNPNLAPATVTFALFAIDNTPLGSSTIVFPPRNYLMKETSELAGGVAPPAGSYLVVSSDEPIQAFGFLADDAAGIVVPHVALSAKY